jgi:hypothetical protein
VYAFDVRRQNELFSSSLLPDIFQNLLNNQPWRIHMNLAVANSRNDGNARLVFLDIDNSLKVFKRSSVRRHDDGGGGSVSDWVVERCIHLSPVTLGVPWYRDCFISPPVTSSSVETVNTVRITVLRVWREPNFELEFNVDLGIMDLERTYWTTTGYPIKLPYGRRPCTPALYMMETASDPVIYVCICYCIN